MFVDTDRLEGLTHDSTLKECLMALVYFDPEIAQTIYQAWPAALHLKLKELAQVSADQFINKPTPVKVTMTHLRALNELLCHFGYHIKHSDFTLSPAQIKRVLQVYAHGSVDESKLDEAMNVVEDDAAFLRGYLTGMAYALGTTWQDLLRHAQYLNRNGEFGDFE